MELNLILGGVVLGQAVYYGWLIHALTSKLMSRNYYEYEEAKRTKKQDKKVSEPAAYEEEDLRALGIIIN